MFFSLNLIAAETEKKIPPFKLPGNLNVLLVNGNIEKIQAFFEESENQSFVHGMGSLKSWEIKAGLSNGCFDSHIYSVTFGYYNPPVEEPFVRLHAEGVSVGLCPLTLQVAEIDGLSPKKTASFVFSFFDSDLKFTLFYHKKINESTTTFMAAAILHREFLIGKK